jgi:hypothetical protein
MVLSERKAMSTGEWFFLARYGMLYPYPVGTGKAYHIWVSLTSERKGRWNAENAYFADLAYEVQMTILKRKGNG